MMKSWMKWTLSGLIICGIVLVTALKAVRAENQPGEFLAAVDDRQITVEAFQAAMSRSPKKYADPGQKDVLLEEMVRFEVLYTAAREAGYDQDPAIIERFRRLLANKYRQDILAPRLENVQVTDEEVEKYYRAHQDEITVGKKVRAAVIRISVPAGASDEKKAQLTGWAETARGEALRLKPATHSFGPVAVRYSDHQPTRYRGGDTGWLKAGKNDSRWPKAVNRAIFSRAEPGTVSPVITTTGGYYIVKLMETQKSAPRPLSAVKAQIRHQLIQQKQKQAEFEFYEELKARIPVRIDRTILEAINPAAGDPAMSAGQPPGLPRQ